MPQLKLTADILSAAVIGFEVQKNRIDARIAEIKQMLDGGRPEPAAPTDTGKPGRSAVPPYDGRWLWRNGRDTPSLSKSASRRQPWSQSQSGR